MKPVATSLLALALSTTSLLASAAPASRPASSKTPAVAPARANTKAKETKKVASRGPKATKEPPRVAAPAAKAHHAEGVNVEGTGHHEPKVGARSDVLATVSARHVDKPARERTNADKQAKADAETEELVARIRGNAAPSGARAASAPPAEACKKDPVEIVRGPEVSKFSLTKCDGTIAPLAVEQLSVLIRPGSAARPTATFQELAKTKGPELAHGIRRVDARLVERIQAVVDHFGARGVAPKLSIISGYRPTSVGSMHQTGRAVDFRIEGVKNEEIVAFCKTLVDTGCGYYPNSSFVHVDVRDPGAGHVTWIDASGPGEAPRYVSSWPPPEAPKPVPVETSEPRPEEIATKRPAADILEQTSARRRVEAALPSTEFVEELPGAD